MNIAQFFLSFVGGIFDVVHSFILNNYAKTSIHVLANMNIWTWGIRILANMEYFILCWYNDLVECLNHIVNIYLIFK